MPCSSKHSESLKLFFFFAFLSTIHLFYPFLLPSVSPPLFLISFCTCYLYHTPWIFLCSSSLNFVFLLFHFNWQWLYLAFFSLDFLIGLFIRVFVWWQCNILPVAVVRQKEKSGHTICRFIKHQKKKITSTEPMTILLDRKNYWLLNHKLTSCERFL